MVVGDTAEILTVGVVPAARRTGIGAGCWPPCWPRRSAAAPPRPSSRCGSTTTPRCALYAREGFAELGLRRGYYDAGRVDAVTMRQEL